MLEKRTYTGTLGITNRKTVYMTNSDKGQILLARLQIILGDSCIFAEANMDFLSRCAAGG